MFFHEIFNVQQKMFGQQERFFFINYETTAGDNLEKIFLRLSTFIRKINIFFFAILSFKNKNSDKILLKV